MRKPTRHASASEWAPIPGPSIFSLSVSAAMLVTPTLLQRTGMYQDLYSTDRSSSLASVCTPLSEGGGVNLWHVCATFLVGRAGTVQRATATIGFACHRCVAARSPLGIRPSGTPSHDSQLMMPMTVRMISELPPFEPDAVQGGCGSRPMDRPVARPGDRVIVFGSRAYGVNARSLSDLGSVGCKLTAAVHFSSASWPIAMAMSRRIRQKLFSPGPILAPPHSVNASMPQARRAPGPQGFLRPTGCIEILA